MTIKTTLQKIQEKIKARVIPEWRQAHHYWSVRINALGVFLMGGVEIMKDEWSSLPPDLKHFIPYANILALVVFMAGIAARYSKQGGHDGQTSDQETSD